MQVGLLSSPHWLIGLAALLAAIFAKGTLAFCEALAKNNRSNGNRKGSLPTSLERLTKDSPERDGLRLGESCCGVVVSVVVFLFLWDFSALLGSFPGMLPKIALAVGLAGLTAVFQHTSTVSFPRILALKASPAVWRKVFWIPVLIRWLTLPVRWLVKLKEWKMRRLLGVGKQTSNGDELQAEIEALGDGSGDDPSSGIRQIVDNTLQLRTLSGQDILLPRNQVEVLDLNDSLEKNLARAKQSGHTRFPLCDGDLDHCVGIVHVKDVFREMAEGKEVKLAGIKRDFATFSPEDPLIVILQEMLRGRLHMALVRDEFGGAIGVLTLEDALEEVVGEIKDEFDASEEDSIRKQADGSFVVSGLAPIHEVEEVIGTHCANEEVSTFGGWITMALGRIPQRNEKFLLDNLDVMIEEADETRVIAASVKLTADEKLKTDDA